MRYIISLVLNFKLKRFLSRKGFITLNNKIQPKKIEKLDQDYIQSILRNLFYNRASTKGLKEHLLFILELDQESYVFNNEIYKEFLKEIGFIEKFMSAGDYKKLIEIFYEEITFEYDPETIESITKSIEVTLLSEDEEKTFLLNTLLSHIINWPESVSLKGHDYL